MTRGMVTRLALVVAVCLFAAIVPAVAATYDVAVDFSATANPNGAWSYNYWVPGVTLLANGGAYQSDTNIGGWTINASTAVPYILKTPNTSEYVAGGVHFMPDEVVMHSDGWMWAVVRFTVPETGDYTWTVSYTGREEGGSTSVAAYNPTWGAYSGGTITYGQTVGFDTAGLLRHLEAGDYMDLYLEGDAVGLKATFSTPLPGQVTGVVRSNMPGNPVVPGVSVTVLGEVAATTDENGVYTVTGLLDGTYDLTFAKPGFVTQTLEDVPVTIGEVTTSDVILETSQLAGTVTSNQPGNPPIAGVRVLIVETGNDAVTDATGHYVVQAVPGTYTAKFTLSGYNTATATDQVLTTGAVTTLNQQLTFSTEVWDAGYDFQGAGNPGGVWTYGYAFDGGYLTPYAKTTTPYPTVPFVQWDEVSDGTTGGLVAKSWSDAEQIIYGGYVPPCPAELPHTLVLHPGMSGDKATVRWTAPRAMNVQIRSKFTGINYVQTSTDCHVYHNGVSLLDYFINGFVGSAGSNYTNHLGASYECDRWTVAQVAAGDTIDFAVGFGENGTWQDDITGLIATIEPSDVAPGTVSGTVLSGAPGNPPIEGAKVQTDDGRFWATTAYDGTYTMTVPSGSVTLTASKATFGNVTKTVYAPTNGSTTCNFTLPTGQITGQVTATIGGVLTALAGVQIRSDDGAFETYTLEDGSYLIDLPPATYTFEAFLPGFDKQTAIVVVSGNTPQDWTLVQSATIEADLAGDFMLGANPNGTWSYGYYSGSIPGGFVQYGPEYRLTISPGQIEGWGDAAVSVGLIAKNLTSAPIYWYGNFSAGGVDAHPGVGNMIPTARWTAPQAAKLLVTAEFADAQNPTHGEGATTQGIVLHNGTTVVSGLVDHYNGPLIWSGATIINVAQGDTIDFSLEMSANGISADMTKMNGHITVAPAPVLVPTIGALKSVASGTYVRLEGKAAICAGTTFPDAFFIEELDRSAALSVVGAPGVDTVLVGDRVTLTGIVSGPAGQQHIVADSLTREPGTELGALGVINRSAAATILTLGRIWGTVTAVDTAEAPTYFYVNDGSNMADGSGNIGIKVDISTLASADELAAIRAKMAAFVPGETFVSVTGILGISGTGSPIHPRTEADID